MKHLSVTRKLWLGVTFIVLGSAVIVSLAGYQSASHQKKHSQQDQLLSLRLEQATAWNALSQVNAVRTMASLMSADPQDAAEFNQQITATSQSITQMQQALEASSPHTEDRAQLQKISQLRQHMQSLREQAIQQTDSQERRRWARQELRSASDAYIHALRDYALLQAQALADMRAAMGAARQGVVRSAAFNMLALLLSIAIGAYLLINSIRKSMSEANRIAQHIAEGDLRTTHHVERQDEFGQLVKSLHGMSQSLALMIEDVRDSGDTIHLASNEIASGNQDLSQRTEVTSSHLQQAASSMMQLSHNLQETADNAQNAASLALQATSVAQRGGDVVSEVVSTMTDIHARSQKISDIIGVIDGIAFQTNILALNAAVEAARAGDQGRGFAVVAAEVRTLAQRSAQAAKEIKELIQDSVNRMADGARLVQDAGSTMNEVVTSIAGVTQAMDRINTSAAQQRDDVAHISEAVGTLDQMTQQNSTLVEQSAAAAHSLREQAEHLRRLVQRFKVATNAPSMKHSSHNPLTAFANTHTPATVRSHGLVVASLPIHSPLKPTTLQA